MPTVPQYERQVRDSALPSARLTQAADTEAFGGGSSFQQVANATQKFIIQEKQKADDIATTEAYSQAVIAKNRLMYDPENGMMTRKGKNAIGVVEEYGDLFNTEMDKIEKGLSNNSQRSVFKNIRLKQATELNNNSQRHVFTESQRYDEETTLATITVAREDAFKNYQDEGKISESIFIQTAAIEAYGARQGLPKEIIAKQKQEAVSLTHAGVINRMLNNNQDKLAKAYFTEIKKSLTGSDTAKIEKSLEVGTLRGEAQRKTDEIKGTVSTLSEGLEMARTIDDPELRDAVTSRLKTRFSEDKAILDQQRETRYQQAADILEETKDRDKIPVDIWSNLTLSERNAIDARERQLASGTPTATDWKVYYELKTLASDSTLRNKFLRENLLTYRHKLGDGEFKELVKLQTSLRQGDQKALEQATGYRTENQIVTDTLRAIGIDPKKDAEETALLKRRLDEEIYDFSKRNNKKPNTKEVQEIVDNLVVKGEVDGFFFNPNKFLFEVEEGDVFLIDSKDIPRNERLKIEEALRANNLPVTEDAVIDLYNRKIQRTLSNAN